LNSGAGLSKVKDSGITMGLDFKESTKVANVTGVNKISDGVLGFVKLSVSATI